jgi:hypothetical protein
MCPLEKVKFSFVEHVKKALSHSSVFSLHNIRVKASTLAAVVGLKVQPDIQSLIGEPSAVVSSGPPKFATSVTDPCKASVSSAYFPLFKINNPEVRNFLLKHRPTLADPPYWST